MSTTKLTYLQYSTLLQFAWDEELERTREMLEALEHPEEDLSDDKHWVTHPEVLPSIEQLAQAVQACQVPLETIMEHAKQRQDGEGDEDEIDDTYNSLRAAWMDLP